MIPITLALTFAAVLQVGVGRTVLVTVLDSSNQPVVDLEPDDFVVRESGQQVEILSERIADYPVVVLIDNSSGGRADLDVMRAAAARFITRLGQRPIALGTLGRVPAIVASFDDDRSALLQRLGAITAETAGGEQLIPGTASAARMLQALDAPFSAIVVISASAAVTPSATPGESNREILDSHAFVSAVVRRAGDAGAAVDSLRALVGQTHGQFTTIYSPSSYQIALDRLGDALATELMIEYVAPRNAPNKEAVTVGVRVPGARVKGLGVR